MICADHTSDVCMNFCNRHRRRNMPPKMKKNLFNSYPSGPLIVLHQELETFCTNDCDLDLGGPNGAFFQPCASLLDLDLHVSTILKIMRNIIGLHSRGKFVMIKSSGQLLHLSPHPHYSQHTSNEGSIRIQLEYKV
ncbi:hypothetical protein H5410_013444 [Solanum commersonii]|uniref:Uncharacterized protein n=1 Tax=Solanum commersonii TaxID=4109 RepID=A0A9J6AVF3_SOLCO|nr:hypothetical protein H5410_013444 [Solanum commersonii]